MAIYFCVLLHFVLLLNHGNIINSNQAVLPSDQRLIQDLTKFGEGQINQPTFVEVDQSRVLASVLRLQQHTPKTSALYQYIAFTLAYFRIEYHRNIRLLEQPVEAWLRNPKQASKEYVEIGGGAGMALFPGLLMRLYLHKKDKYIATTLFAWHLDGYAEEVLSDVRVTLMKSCLSKILKIISQSSKLLDNAALALSTASPNDYLVITRKLERKNYQQNNRTKMTVRLLLRKTQQLRVKNGT